MMTVYLWVFMILYAVVACMHLHRLMMEQYPYKQERNVGEDVVAMLMAIGFGLWTAVLLFWR
jgi:hypothetical protein